MAVVGAAFPPPHPREQAQGRAAQGLPRGPLILEAQSSPSLRGDTEGTGTGQEVREGAGGRAFGDSSPRVAPRKTAARTQISSSSSRTPRRTLVTPMTRLCIWPSGLGWGLGGSVGGSRTPSAGGQGSEPGTQRPAPPSPTPPHAVSKPAPGQGFRAQGHPQRPCRQPPFSRTVGLGVLTAVEGKGGGHHGPGCGAEVRHGAWRPRGHPAVAAPTPARGPAPRSGLQRPHLSL